MFSNFFLKNHTLYEEKKNVVELGRPLTIWHMRFSCCIPKDTDTHSEYVILIALPLQQLSHNTPHCYFICTLPELLRSHF